MKENKINWCLYNETVLIGSVFGVKFFHITIATESMIEKGTPLLFNMAVDWCKFTAYESFGTYYFFGKTTIKELKEEADKIVKRMSKAMEVLANG